MRLSLDTRRIHRCSDYIDPSGYRYHLALSLRYSIIVNIIKYIVVWFVRDHIPVHDYQKSSAFIHKITKYLVSY